MKKHLLHIVLIVSLLACFSTSKGQAPRRYVQHNSQHALMVPDNPDYSFEWTIRYGATGQIIVHPDSTNITQNIRWTHAGGRSLTYHISVLPVLDSVGCYGEPVLLQVITVDYLSLFLFDDVYFTDIDTPVSGDVSENDFDETDANIYYNPLPLVDTKNGALELFPDGSFTYTPNPGFVGIDTFVYEGYNNHDIPMYSSAQVTIVVQDNSKQADLHIEKTGPIKALYGQEIEYTVMITNLGPDMAENVIMTDEMTFGLFNPQYRDENGVKQVWPGNIGVGNLAPGDTVYYYLYGTSSMNSPQFVYNQALVYSDTYDPEHRNNSSIWKTEMAMIFIDLQDIFVAACDFDTLPGDRSGSLANIRSYLWTPAIGLDDPTRPSPRFDPDENTIGRSTEYVLRVEDENGRIVLDTMNVVVSELPVAVIEADTIFMDLGQTITINADESSGENLRYFWTSADGNLEGPLNRDSVRISAIGTYVLEVEDMHGCIDIATVVVLLQSHPPVTLPDNVTIVAGSDIVLPNLGAEYLALSNNPVQQLEYWNTLPDSSINVLLNDYDRNEFNISVFEVLTEPQHSTYSWNSDGTFVIQPDSGFWGLDSMQYRVCNDGIPVECSNEWIYIRSLRPPLNADLVIEKTGDDITFWGEMMHYELRIWNTGPDTVNLTTISDPISPHLIYPEYSLDAGETWERWFDELDYTQSILPGEDTLSILLRAEVRNDPGAFNYIYNRAWIETAIVENDLENDTTQNIETIVTEAVVAIAGNDTIIGSCHPSFQLDGSASTGDAITFNWVPFGHTHQMINRTTATPVFSNPGTGGTYTYVLHISDKFGISDTDTITVTVLQAPQARVQREYYEIEVSDTIAISGQPSTGVGLSFHWETSNGYILPGTENSMAAAINQIGSYTLTVTDIAGCESTATVEVYRFYHKPFAIPDFYSTTQNEALSVSGVESLLYNDFDPNGLDPDLKISATGSQGIPTQESGRVVIHENGDFTYTPPANQSGIIDRFEYTLCSNIDGVERCEIGYAQITINRNDGDNRSNFSITKTAIHGRALINDVNGVQFEIVITNQGPKDATGVMITDMISEYLRTPRWRLSGTGPYNPLNQINYNIPVGNLAVGESRTYEVVATANADSPGRIYNAASVASAIFDGQWLWDDMANRNVDTASVIIESNLLARAMLVEMFDNDHDDQRIGACDLLSFLSAEESVPQDEIESYEWSPRNLLTHPDSSITGFTHLVSDTTVEFSLQVRSGTDVKFDFVTVHFSPRVIADAGPDRKVNPGETLTIDATRSGGAEAVFNWNVLSGSPITRFENGNRLLPVVSGTGVYELTVSDMHGCVAIDTVTIRENDLIPVNDIAVALVNTSFTGNVGINDYDPDGDNIHFSGSVTGPQQGTLSDVVGQPAGTKIAPDGGYTYVPKLNFTGYDYFDYEVCDDNDPDLCKWARVYIRVIDVTLPNTPPVANHDHFFVNPGSELRSNLLNNDYDVDGGQINMTEIVQLPLKGDIDFDAEGNIVYTPHEGEQGDDYFEYRICDDANTPACNTALVKITIHKLADDNHRPVAADDAYYTTTGMPVSGNVLWNDFDPDGDEFELRIDTDFEPQYGDIDFWRDGRFTYIPSPGFEGTDYVAYQICETRTPERLCDNGVLYITVIDEKRYTTDLAIVKTAPETALSGTVIDYTISVTNNGPTLANNVTIHDKPDSVLTNVQYSFNAEAWETWNDSVSISQMLPGTDTTVYIRANIPIVFQGELLNKAVVTHNMNELDPANNESEVTTEVFQRIIAHAGTDTVIGACFVDTFELDASESLGAPGMQYTWSPQFLVQNHSVAVTGINLTAGETQEYMLIVTNTIDGFSDSDTTYVTVSVAEAPLANAGGDVYPDEAQPVYIDGSGSSGAGPLTYQWWTYDENNEVVVLSDTHEITVERSGEFFLTVTDRYGCSHTDNIYVGYHVERFIAVDDYIETWQQESVDIYVLHNDIIDPNDSYDLDLVLVNQNPSHGRLHRFPSDSFYTYTPDVYFTGIDSFVYSVTTTSNYYDEAMVVILVKEKPPVVPGGFSPNGDGINDFLLIENIELYEENSLVIFSRWGNIVYEMEGYSNSEPWDGVANSGVRIGRGAVPTGVYFYILDLGPNELITERYVKGNIYIASDNRR